MAWNTDSTANRLIKSYVQDFIDISGSLILRDKSNLYVNGNATVNGNLFLNNASILTDLSFNKKIFVGGDCSLNGKLTSVGDISINGAVTRSGFNNSSIPQTAFNGTISAPGPDYTKSSVFYEQKFKADADISLNGNVVQVNNIKINGNIKFSDDSSLNKYDNNIDYQIRDTFFSGVTFTKPTNAANLDITTIQSSTGKVIIMSIGASINYGFGIMNINSNVPVGTLVNSVDASWNNYTKFGAYITRDYGNTWTKYLVPYEDGTKLGYAYFGSAMSTDGKHILIVVNPGGNNPAGNPSAVAFSHDYGYTWSSVRVPFYTAAVPGTNDTCKTCCMSNDGRKMLVSNGGQSLTWYYSINYGLSWARTATWGNNGLMFENGSVNNVFCNADLSLVIIRMKGDAYKGFVRLRLDDNMILIPGSLTDNRFDATPPGGQADTLFWIPYTRLAIDGSAFPVRTEASVQKVAYSVDLKTVLFAHFGGNIIKANNTINIELYDATIDRWRMGIISLTTTGFTSGTSNIAFGYSALSVAMSRSGQFIYLTSELPNYLPVHFTSSDYGSTFTQVFPTPTTYTVVHDIMDDGTILTGTADNITLFKPNVYKASTFTSLNLTGNLIASGFTLSSDYRIKTDIAALDDTFTIDNLRPVKYLQTLINKTRYGVIAHELQLYYPDLVVGDKDGEDLQYVNYTGLIAILINEIKRLKQEVLELENEV